MVKRNLMSDYGSSSRYAKRTRPTRVSRPLRSAINTSARQAVLRLAEKKEYLFQHDEVAVSTIAQGADWTHCTDLASGTARNSKEVLLQSLRCRGVLHNNANGTNLVRMVVFYAEDEVVPSNIAEYFMSSSSLLSTVAFGNAAVAGLNAMYQPLNPSKVTVLKDRVFKLAAVGSTDGAQVVPYDFTIKLRNAKIKYEGNTQGPGNQNRMLYIGLWAAEGADDTGVGTVVEWSGVAHLKYLDI